jgi:DNA helicase-2/ATP-dependent DNA helicase PcrA
MNEGGMAIIGSLLDRGSSAIPIEINSKEIKLSDLGKKNILFGIPGSGKTTAIETIISNVKEQHLSFFYVTYSRAMGKEARVRIDEHDKSHIGTLHSILSKILGWRAGKDGIFLTDEDIEKFCQKYNIKKLKKVRPWEEIISDDMDDDWSQFSMAYDKAINSLKGITEIKNILQDVNFNPLYIAQKYEEYKNELKKKDYTDILIEVERNPEVLPNTDFLFVDEAQDLTPLMWKIITEWSKKAGVVIIAGDDDQSIYTFKGADASFFLAQRVNAKIFHLPVSYRVPKEIRDLAVSIISRVKNREKKNFISIQDGGVVSQTTSLNEFVHLPGSKYILGRTRYILEKVSEILIMEGIPFLPINARHQNLSPWSEKLIKLTNAISKFPDVPEEDIIILIENSPAHIFHRGIKTLAEQGPENIIQKYSQNLEHKFNFKYLLKDQNMTKEQFLNAMNINPDKKTLIRKYINSGINEEDICYLDTFHASKGKEADHIAIVLDITQKIFENLYTRFEDEYRLLYVAVTRARKSVNLIYLGLTGMAYDVKVNTNGSRIQQGSEKMEVFETKEKSVFSKPDL